MLASDVEARSFALGLMLVSFGGVFLLLGLFFLLAAASGSLRAESGYFGTLLILGIGVVFIVAGISAMKRYTWLFWILRLLVWS